MPSSRTTRPFHTAEHTSRARQRRTLRRRRTRSDIVTWITIVASYAAAGLSGALIMRGLSPVRVERIEAGTGRILADPVTTPPEAYDWYEQAEPHFAIPAYARFLRGVKIVLDPGHVGQNTDDKPSDWKRGPTGLREAEANLRVALFLRDFLRAAGADVVMTRERDKNLKMSDEADLRDRIAVANRARADLFLSIHHNAARDPSSNYTSVFYHGSPDHSPASLCAASYLVTGLNEALRLDDVLGCALRSDYVQYPGKGFAVLRDAEVPAVLSESSFHSNPAEEQRLRDPVYNRREAYGLFLGLARWAQAGLPRVRLAPPSTAPTQPRDAGTIMLLLDDGFTGREQTSGEVKIRADSLRAEINGKPVVFTPDLAKRQLRIEVPPELRGKRLRVFVDFENVFGQHVLHPELLVGR